jgi:hypothetical protein
MVGPEADRLGRRLAATALTQKAIRSVRNQPMVGSWFNDPGTHHFAVDAVALFLSRAILVPTMFRSLPFELGELCLVL